MTDETNPAALDRLNVEVSAHGGELAMALETARNINMDQAAHSEPQRRMAYAILRSHGVADILPILRDAAVVTHA